MSKRALSYRASILHRRISCPGSGWAESDLPDEPDSDTALEGTMLHAVLSGMGNREVSGLTASQEYDVKRAKSIEHKITTKVFAGATTTEIREKRIALFDGGEMLMTGHPDLILLGENRLMVIDYKLGPIPVTAAEQNWQLATYAVAASDLYEITDVYTAIIQPRGYHGASPFTLAQYSAMELEVARKAILRAIEICEESDAPRVPSLDACRYCRARGTDKCPETQHFLVETVKPFLSNLEGPALMSEIHKRVAELPPKALGELLIAYELLDKIGVAAELRARKILNNGETLETDEWVWGMGKVGTQRAISNNRAALERLERASNGLFTAADLASCSTIKITDVDSRWQTITGLNQKQSKANLEDVLGDSLEKRDKNPALVKQRKGKKS